MQLLREAVQLSLQDTKRHLTFAFTCPAGVSDLHLEWRFSPAGAGELRTLVTLSVRGPDGFRGAGHRHGDHQQVHLGRQGATPGYLPGPLPAGRWAVTLHTHLVADVTVGELSVTAVSDAPAGVEAAEPSPPARRLPQGAWMMGDLHCHTTHSDGRWTPTALAAAAVERGLSFLALTDHNTVSGRAELQRAFPGLTLPGLELTTYYGHATVIGTPEYLDWTALEPDQGMRALAERVTRQGAQLTIAHPFAVGDPLCTGCAWTTFDLRPETTTHLEVWNGPWAGGARHNERALACWYRLLTAGRRVVATAGTDAHGPAYPAGAGFTCTPSTDDPAVLRRQLRSGTTYLGTLPGLAPEILTPDDPVPLGGVGAPGRWAASLNVDGLPPHSALVAVVDGARRPQTLPASGRWHGHFEVRRWLNLEVRGPDGALLALTNPVYAGQGAQRRESGGPPLPTV